MTMKLLKLLFITFILTINSVFAEVNNISSPDVATLKDINFQNGYSYIFKNGEIDILMKSEDPTAYNGVKILSFDDTLNDMFMKIEKIKALVCKSTYRPQNITIT